MIATAHTSARRPLHALQCLRGVAALLVVVNHAFALGSAPFGLTDRTIEIGVYLGQVGVYVFFVISGFIMMRTSNEAFGALGSARSFLVKRIIRVAPLYWLATSVELVIRIAAGQPPHFSTVLSSLLFLPYDRGGVAGMMPLLFVGWTLNYEMFFYALFAVALCLPRRWGITALFLALVAIVAIGAAIRPITDATAVTSLATFWTAPIILLFAVGAFIGLLEKRFAGSLSPRQAMAVSTALAALMVVAFIVTGAGAYDFGFRCITWVACALAVAACAAEAPEGAAPARVAQLVGDASYSIYLFHFFVVLIVQQVCLSAFGPEAFAPAFFVSVVSATVAGIVIHLFVEQPGIALLRRFGESRGATPNFIPVHRPTV